MRAFGRVLVAVGLLVAVLGVSYLKLLAGVSENRTDLNTFGAFLDGLAATALFAAPGMLVALAGWGLVRSYQPASGERIRQSWPLRSVWAGLVLVAWVGVAVSISTTPAPQPAPPSKPRTLAQQRADQAAFDARTTADRVGHPVPAVELRRTERNLEARLRKQNGGLEANAACRRVYGWDIACDVDVTGTAAVPEHSSVQGRYLPQARMVLFDTPVPGDQP